MSLAIPVNTPELPKGFFQVPVAAAATIYAGALVALNASGYAVPAADASGLKALGRAEADALNAAGLAGALTLTVKRGVFGYSNDATNPVAITHVGSACYVVDDATVSSDGGTNSIVAGLVVALLDDLVYVDTTLAPVL